MALSLARRGGLAGVRGLDHLDVAAAHAVQRAGRVAQQQRAVAVEPGDLADSVDAVDRRARREARAPCARATPG